MLVKGDSGLLNAHILIKFLCKIPIHSKYVQFLLVPKYEYSLYNFKWCLYKLMTDLYCDQSEVTKNIMNSFHLLSWFQKHPIEKHPRFYTFVQTCRLCVQSSGSHLATGFSSCGVIGTSTTLLKWPFIPLCSVSVAAHFESFSSEILSDDEFSKCPSRHWLLPAWYCVRLRSWGIHLVLVEYNSLCQYCHDL